jgi:hypothetical protein
MLGRHGSRSYRVDFIHWNMDIIVFASRTTTNGLVISRELACSNVPSNSSKKTPPWNEITDRRRLGIPGFVSAISKLLVSLMELAYVTVFLYLA